MTSILFENYQVEARLICDVMAYVREQVELRQGGVSSQTEEWMRVEIALRRSLPTNAQKTDLAMPLASAQRLASSVPHIC